MRIPCWRITFKGTVTLPISSGSRYAQTIQTRHPKGTNAGVVTEGVTLTWCGYHVEIAGTEGIALIPAQDVAQVDAIVVDGHVQNENDDPRVAALAAEYDARAAKRAKATPAVT